MIDEQATPAAVPHPVVWHFGTFRLDPGNALLTEGARHLDLAPRAFAVLCYLVEQPGLLVTKEQLLDAVWGRRFVSESVLKTTINLIRSALGDDARAPRFIETVARRGYRFVGKSTGHGTSLTGPAGAPTTTAPAAAVHAAGLIGRLELIERLAAWMDDASSGRHQLVLLGGAAGIGKTSLIRHLAESALARGQSVAVGQCVEQAGGGEPYLPVLEALAELTRGANAAVWLDGLRIAAPTWLAQMPWLVAGSDKGHLRDELAGAAQGRMLREFGALLDLATRTQPLLLVIEDLHWSDHATVSLLDYLARRRGEGRWMLVASFRPGNVAADAHPMEAMRQELGMHKLCRELSLAPFTGPEVNEYLRQRLRGRAPRHADVLALALHRHTGGMPLFLAHVLDELEGNALMRSDDPVWEEPVAVLIRLQLPSTVVASIGRQLERLDSGRLELLEAASVLGMEFNHVLLARLLDQDVERVRSSCDGLTRRAEWLRDAGLVTLPEDAIGGKYAFTHSLHRRVLYERCTPMRRLQLHLRAGQILQGWFGSHSDRAAEVAQHFEDARDTATTCGVELASAARDASLWRIRAARAAVAVHAPVDALAHYAMAERHPLEPEERVRVGIETAALHQQLGAGARAMAQNSAALETARSITEPSLLRDALLQRAKLCQQNDRHDEAIAYVGELLALKPALSPALRAIALVVKADALDCMGRLEEADAAASEAESCLPADNDAARARFLHSRVDAHHHRGQLEAGLQSIADALALFERMGDAVGASGMVTRRGLFLMLLGRAHEAEATLRDALARGQATNDVGGQRKAILNLAKVLTDRGDASGALALLESGWLLSSSFESPVSECAFLSGFYYCNYLRGDLGAAWRDANRVLASARNLSSFAWRVGSLVLVCPLYIYLGDLQGARTLADRALAETHSRELHHIGVQTMTQDVWLDVLTGQAARALSKLDAARDSGESIQPEDLSGLSRVRAQAHLALGQPEAALQVLKSDTGTPTQEVLALMLALRFQAQIATDGVDTADLDVARAELASGQLPAIECARLRRSFACALRHLGHHERAAEEFALLAQQSQSLADSLSEQPELQRSFIETMAA